MPYHDLHVSNLLNESVINVNTVESGRQSQEELVEDHLEDLIKIKLAASQSAYPPPPLPLKTLPPPPASTTPTSSLSGASARTRNEVEQTSPLRIASLTSVSPFSTTRLSPSALPRRSTISSISSPSSRFDDRKIPVLPFPSSSSSTSSLSSSPSSPVKNKRIRTQTQQGLSSSPSLKFASSSSLSSHSNSNRPLMSSNSLGKSRQRAFSSIPSSSSFSTRRKLEGEDDDRTPSWMKNESPLVFRENSLLNKNDEPSWDNVVLPAVARRLEAEKILQEQQHDEEARLISEYHADGSPKSTDLSSSRISRSRSLPLVPVSPPLPSFPPAPSTPRAVKTTPTPLKLLPMTTTATSVPPLLPPPRTPEKSASLRSSLRSSPSPRRPTGSISSSPTDRPLPSPKPFTDCVEPEQIQLREQQQHWEDNSARVKGSDYGRRREERETTMREDQEEQRATTAGCGGCCVVV